jgi:hypothetical protein
MTNLGKISGQTVEPPSAKRLSSTLVFGLTQRRMPVMLIGRVHDGSLGFHNGAVKLLEKDLGRHLQ